MRTKLFIPIFLLLSFAGYTQTKDGSELAEQITNIVPPPPDAAAITKFGDIPVDYHNGLPQIEIPIYTIKLKQVSVPISLKYHASGIKVNDVASSVGLGWALNAGGTIAQTVIGKLNLPGSGVSLPSDPYNFDPNIALSDPPSTDYNYANNLIESALDSHPDKYTFSLLGRAGQIVWDSNQVGHSIPYQKLKITSTGGYKIVDEKGIIYTFGVSESQISEDECLVTPPSAYDRTINGTLTYHLSKIETPNGEIVNFTYETVNYTYYSSEYQTEFSALDLSVGGCDQTIPGTQCKQKITVTGKRLTNIQAVDGHSVSFKYGTSRTDLPGTHSLDSIRIKGVDGIVERNFIMDYSYFNNSNTSDPENYKRLKLLSVTEQAPFTSNTKVHSFTYNETIALPPRLSNDRDHWGYYNGAGNGPNLIPDIAYLGLDYSSGTDRSASAAHREAGILTEIKYPTGGTTKFDYESYQYLHTGTEYSWSTQTLYSKVVAADQIYIENDAFTYDINNHKTLTFYFTLYDARSLIEIVGPDQTIQIDENSTSPITIQNPTPGSYDVDILNRSETNTATLTVKAEGLVGTSVSENRIKGTIRIRQITDGDDEGNPDVVRYFDYLEPSTTTEGALTTTSSAHAVGIPKYWSIHNVFSDNDLSGNNYCKYYSLSSASNVENKATAYKAVTVSYGSPSGTEGRTILEYTNQGDIANGGIAGAQSTDYSWMRGLLEKKTDYRYNNGVFEKVREEENSYTFNHDETDFWEYDQTGAYTSLNEFTSLGLNLKLKRGATATLPAEFEYSFYKQPSAWYYVDSKTVKDYGPTGDSLKTETEYKYDNPEHVQVSRIKTKTSEINEVQVQHMLYAEDYVGNQSDFIELMQNDHQHAYPIEQVTYLENAGGVILGIKTSILNKYYSYVDMGGFQVPGLIEEQYVLENGTLLATNAFKFSNRLNTDVPPTGSSSIWSEHSIGHENRTSLKHNADNNIVEVEQDGASTAYVWGYNGKRVVAKIENADESDVNTALSAPYTITGNLSGTQETALRGMSDVMVTTYEYDNMLRLTRIKPPNELHQDFSYDRFDRLIQVKDHQGNILSENSYNYNPSN